MLAEANRREVARPRITPELSRPTAREPGVELMPQQRLCLQMGRSGFGLNDLLGAARLPTEGDGDEQYKGSTQDKSGECVRQRFCCGPGSSTILAPIDQGSSSTGEAQNPCGSNT